MNQILLLFDKGKLWVRFHIGRVSERVLHVCAREKVRKSMKIDILTQYFIKRETLGNFGQLISSKIRLKGKLHFETSKPARMRRIRAQTHTLERALI